VVLSDWLLADLRVPKGILSKPDGEHAWWRVMCLTGVDYFSTLWGISQASPFSLPVSFRHLPL
jgi:hypothetical protein